MAKLLKLRRGTTSQHSSFTGAEGEVTVDTNKDTLVVHDGSTAGGHPVAAEDMANVSAANIKGRLGTTLTNAEINGSAAIAGTKISPDFGSQNITTTGTIRSTGNGGTISVGDNNDLFISHTNNGLIDNNAGDLTIQTQNAMQLKTADAEFGIQLVKHGGVQLYHDDAGPKLETTGSGVSVTGNITVSGTVDGIDIATDVAANTAKVTNASHTGEVTGATSLTIADNVVDEANLKVSNSPTNGYMLTAQSGNTGGLTWAAVPAADFGSIGEHVLPSANNTYNLGSSSYRWANIYANDFHLSNEGHSNDVDGTWGDWTIQEGESDLFLKNNRSGKKYKFNLTEVS